MIAGNPNIPELNLPIRNIYCIGRNYAEHARELNNPVPASPVVFMKPASSVIFSPAPIIIPAHGRDLQHEAELVVAIGKPASSIQTDHAMEVIAGFGIGLDLTLRDVQSELKEKGHPWEISKAFDGSAPLGPFVHQVSDPMDLSITCKVNGEIRQNSWTSHMIFSIQVLIQYLSSIFTLQPGDLIFTGTPSGVGPLRDGDQVEVSISQIGTVSFKVKSP